MIEPLMIIETNRMLRHFTFKEKKMMLAGIKNGMMKH